MQALSGLCGGEVLYSLQMYKTRRGGKVRREIVCMPYYCFSLSLI